VNELIEAACDLVPGASAASLTAVRVGLRPGTPDSLPIVGLSSVLPNLMYATGHYRNGILLAPLTAEVVADAMLENIVDPMLAITTPQRFGRL
jgi:glycine oxidase